jgi:DNA-binding MarR family transcriptional regulator
MDMSQPVARKNLVDDTALRLAGSIERLIRISVARSELGISRTEVNVLTEVRTQPRRITELTAREGVTQPAMTLLVNRLEERHLVERTGDPTDGRAVLVAITSAGEDLLAQVRAEYTTLLHRHLADISDADVKRLVRTADIFDGLLHRLTDRDGQG